VNKSDYQPPVDPNRYVVQTADVAFPWQHFHRIFDNETGSVVAEGDSREALEEIVRRLGCSSAS